MAAGLAFEFRSFVPAASRMQKWRPVWSWHRVSSTAAAPAAVGLTMSEEASACGCSTGFAPVMVLGRLDGSLLVPLDTSIGGLMAIWVWRPITEFAAAPAAVGLTMSEPAGTCGCPRGFEAVILLGGPDRILLLPFDASLGSLVAIWSFEAEALES